MRKALFVTTTLVTAALGTWGCHADRGDDGPTWPDDGTTAALYADPHFDFATSFQVTVDLDVGAIVSERAYFQICNVVSGDDQSGYRLDYRDCLLRASVDQGRLTATLNVPNHRRELVAELWRLGDGSQPLQFVWRDTTADSNRSWFLRPADAL